MATLLVLVLVGGLMAVSTTTNAQQGVRIEVFTLSTIPMTNAGSAAVYCVDELSRIQSELSAGLQGDHLTARALFAQRWQSLESPLSERIRTAATSIGRAAQLKIHRAPAIVFDGTAVVYGIRDVDYAFHLYKRFRARAGMSQLPVASPAGIADLDTERNRK